jgi:hypothetical protein
MLLLNLHHVAREGDGLAPELLKLLAHRSAIGGDPNIVPLRDFNPGIPNAAGHPPGNSGRGPAGKITVAADGTGRPLRPRHRTL